MSIAPYDGLTTGVAMSPQNGDVQTVAIGDTWVNKVGGMQVGSAFRTQGEAVQAGRQLAMQNRSEHTIHGQDGKIREKTSYGNDPRSIPG
jgi:hypothetical protein